jgi:hypothetical protein
MSLANKFIKRVVPPAMRLARFAEQFLDPDDDWVEEDRRVAFEWLQRHFGKYHDFVYRKGSQDYATTANATSDAVETALARAGFQRNLASARKYRTHHDGGKQWAVGSWVVDPSDTDWQYHVYLFPVPDGRCDVYGHRETSVLEGMEHLTDTHQVHGDPNRRARDALDQAGIDYGQRTLGDGG